MTTYRQPGNKAKRYLETNSTAWRKMRAQVLTEEPHCRHCLHVGIRTLSSEVDHINGRADRREDYLRENLQALCESCHSKKTIAEQNAQAGKPVRQRVGCDRHGFPLTSKT